jgi:hypothetical protein
MNTKARVLPKQKYEQVPEWIEYQVNIPPITKPPYTIDVLNLTEKYLGIWEGVDKREWLLGRGICPGTYTRLWEQTTDEDGEPEKLVWMSDTPAEIIDHWEAISYFRTHEPTDLPVLITGLGLGMVVNAALKHGRNVWVIEKDPNIIALIAPHYVELAKSLGLEVKIIRADAMTWPLHPSNNGQKFEYIWHDIWPKINDLNIFDMVQMFKRYAKFAAGPMQAWAFMECLQMDYAIRMDRNVDQDQQIYDLALEVLDGSWILLGDFLEAFCEGRKDDDYPEGWTFK